MSIPDPLERVARLLGWHLAVMAVLRAAWLGRPDPFGQPVVGKFEWYFFHAIAFDTLQAVEVGLWALPAVLVLTLVASTPSRRRLSSVLAGALALVCAGLVLVAQVDFEVMRFVGTHVNWTLAKTYTNGALFDELPRLLRHDAGGPYVGAVLLVGALIGQVVLQVRAWRQPLSASWLPKRALGLAVAALVATAWTQWIWPGDARAWKLTPALTLVKVALAGSTLQPLSDADRALAWAQHQARWRAAHPDDAAAFVEPARPLVHIGAHAQCVAAGSAALPACATDSDGDGAPLARDCDDRDAAVHPGAAELAGDGVDQDCDGVDSQPWNFLVLVLESHRGMSVKHVPGALDWSPQLDRLAAGGLAQGRATAAALPTIGSFMAIHTGLYACTHCQVATEFTTAHLPSLPKTLRTHGYYARFFSAFDPAWDNQSAWLRHWYDAVAFDRSYEDDAPLLQHVGDWLRRDLAQAAGGKPFFVAVTTRTNHFPFPRIAGVPTTGDDSWPARMRDTMGYTDAAVGQLLRDIEREPWFAHTVVVVTGDHGYPLGEHGAFYLYETLHVEATAVPLIFAGNHPKLRLFRGVVATEPSSHLDLAPTILDLAGITQDGPWVGRSLVRRGQGTTLTYKDGHMAIERGGARVLVDAADVRDAGKAHAYDRLVDPWERKLLPVDPSHGALAAEAELASRWMRWLYANDFIAN